VILVFICECSARRKDRLQGIYTMFFVCLCCLFVRRESVVMTDCRGFRICLRVSVIFIYECIFHYEERLQLI
jgi:hypothetical protein